MIGAQCALKGSDSLSLARGSDFHITSSIRSSPRSSARRPMTRRLNGRGARSS